MASSEKRGALCLSRAQVPASRFSPQQYPAVSYSPEIANGMLYEVAGVERNDGTVEVSVWL